jgi:hypothetical protein
VFDGRWTMRDGESRSLRPQPGGHHQQHGRCHSGEDAGKRVRDSDSFGAMPLTEKHDRLQTEEFGYRAVFLGIALSNCRPLEPSPRPTVTRRPIHRS